jgi:hypothetical protein
MEYIVTVSMLMLVLGVSIAVGLICYLVISILRKEE